MILGVEIRGEVQLILQDVDMRSRHLLRRADRFRKVRRPGERRLGRFESIERAKFLRKRCDEISFNMVTLFRLEICRMMPLNDRQIGVTSTATSLGIKLMMI